ADEDVHQLAGGLAGVVVETQIQQGAGPNQERAGDRLRTGNIGGIGDISGAGHFGRRRHFDGRLSSGGRRRGRRSGRFLGRFLGDVYFCGHGVGDGQLRGQRRGVQAGGVVNGQRGVEVAQAFIFAQVGGGVLVAATGGEQRHSE